MAKKKNKTDKDKLPYRDNVSCVVFKNDKFLLVQLKGWPKEYWKFPQGGVHEGEMEEDTAKRELKEELGTDKFKIVGKSIHTNLYNWDNRSIELAGCRWKGQNQRFYLIEFLGEEKDIKINKKEIQNHKWATRDELPVHIDHDVVYFSNYKASIDKVLKEFEDILG